MTIAIVCPSCSSKLRVADQAAGKTVTCPKSGCRTSIRVPAQAQPEIELEEDDTPRLGKYRRRNDEDDQPIKKKKRKRKKISGLSTGAVIGIVLGALLILGGTGFGVYALAFKRPKVVNRIETDKEEKRSETPKDGKRSERKKDDKYSEAKKSARAMANELQAAFIKGEFGKMIDLMHPKVVEMLGGKERMIAMMTKETQEMASQGISFKSAGALDPSDPVPNGDRLYIVVQFLLVMKVPDGLLNTYSSLVGVSDDGGKSWVFIDSSVGNAKLKQLFPEIPDSLSIPKQVPPQVFRE